MRISDWSSDVCSSDLDRLAHRRRVRERNPRRALAGVLVQYFEIGVGGDRLAGDVVGIGLVEHRGLLCPQHPARGVNAPWHHEASSPSTRTRSVPSANRASSRSPACASPTPPPPPPSPSRTPAQPA